jgi:ABC-2 type transport system ATP-binding protein
MNLFQEKLAIVENHFNNKEYNLGFRKFLDCVLDSNDLDLFESCIALTDWKETTEASDEEIHERIKIELAKLSAIDIPVKAPTILVNANNVSKNYGAKKFNLQAVSITVKSGEIWGLVGENGNGKTTLLRILAQELSHNHGEISYAQDSEKISDYDRRTQLVYIPQRTPKWYGSLKDNLKYAASSYGIKGRENELYVDMLIIRFGLWTYRHLNWDELSSGYKMRFELARTFLRKPKLLLLDEPLANLDVLAQQLILEDLRNMSLSLSNPLGIILSSQQLFEVEKISDKILFLKKGVPTHLSDANENIDNTCVMELDIECTRHELEVALSHLPVSKIDYNGGIYLLTIQDENGFNNILKALLANDFNMKYIRNISHSTKRLFV